MMHFAGESCAINYRGDLSGKTGISVSDPEGDGKYITIEVDGKDLLDFVVEYIKDKKISELKQMETEEFIEKLML